MGSTRRLGKPEVVAVVGGLLLLASTVALTGTDPRAEAGPAAPSFSDVDAAHPFSTEIEWVAAEGIANGFFDGTFRPSLAVSRQAMSAFLHRFAGSPEGPFLDPGFTDVGPGHPFETPIRWMADEGITTGYQDGSFRPGAPVTRQSAAAFLHRLEGEPPPAGDAPSFFDVTVEHPFHQEVAWLAGEGITTGYQDGSFRPSAVVTRQSMAAFLYRLAHRPEPPPPTAPELGNPSNVLGSDPIDPSGGHENLWLNVGAVAANKQYGDRTTNGDCYRIGVPAGDVSGCDGEAEEGDNLDLDPAGHRYLVQVDEITPGEPLRIQVYDPAWTFQGDACTSNQLSSTQLANLAALSETSMNDAETRFAPGSTPYCAGDQSLNGNMAATSYIVRDPDDTPDDDLDNPVTSACDVQTFSGRNISAAGIYDRLRETSAYNQPWEQGFEQVPFRQHFRQWFTVCTIPAGQVEVGDYVVQVRSNPDTSNLPTSALGADPSASSGGHNRFALRAGFGGGASAAPPPDGTGVRVAPTADVALLLNGYATSVQQHVARIDESFAGETVELTFFDVGDVGSGSVSLALIAPPDSNVVTFEGCTARRDGVPALEPTVTSCSITGMTSATYNGRSVVLRIPVPESYTCDESDRFGCWLRLQLVYSGGASPHDTFTLSVGDRTDPPLD